MIKRLNNMSYCTRTMAKSHIRTDINIFYNSTIGGALRYCLVAWCGNRTKADIERIGRIIQKESKVIRVPQPNIDSIYNTGLLNIKLDMVWTESKHPLHVYLHNNIITRGSGILRLPPLKRNQHGNSFIPRAIKLFNDNLCR